MSDAKKYRGLGWTFLPPVHPEPEKVRSRPHTVQRWRGQEIKNQQARAAIVLTKLRRIAWNGDPATRPPPLTKPSSSGVYGECPDEQELPWHLRQKRKPQL